MNGNSVKIAIAGCGAMARARAASLPRLGGELVYVYSRTKGKARAICESTGAQEVNDFGEVLNSSVDAIIICVPNAAHAELARRSLNAAKHVLVEYPLCLLREDCNILTDAAQRNGKVLMVGNTMIHEKMFAYLSQNKGRLGTILSAASRVALYDSDIASTWCMNAEQRGGVFTALHYHHIEYYRHLLGEVLWVRASGGDRIHRAVCGGELLMGHAGGATSCIHWYLCAAQSNRGIPRCLWMNGSESSVTILAAGSDTCEVVWNAGAQEGREQLEEDFGIEASSGDFIKAINGELDDRKRLLSDLQTLCVGFAADESSTTGRSVTLGATQEATRDRSPGRNRIGASIVDEGVNVTPLNTEHGLKGSP